MVEVKLNPGDEILLTFEQDEKEIEVKFNYGKITMKLVSGYLVDQDEPILYESED